MKQLTLVACLILFSNIKIAHGLKCYSCSVPEYAIDRQCITDPAGMNPSAVINCNKKYCASTRIEYRDPKDKVQSMFRDCTDEPLYINEVIIDSTFRSYYLACTTDLCNGGSGKNFDMAGSSNLKGSNFLIIPGIGERNSANTLLLNNLLLFFITLYVLYFTF